LNWRSGSTSETTTLQEAGKTEKKAPGPWNKSGGSGGKLRQTFKHLSQRYWTAAWQIGRRFWA
jgi:hypothetical protein